MIHQPTAFVRHLVSWANLPNPSTPFDIDEAVFFKGNSSSILSHSVEPQEKHVKSPARFDFEMTFKD